MASNTQKKPLSKESVGGKSPFRRFFSSLLDGSILARENVESMLPFFIYLAALAVFLIFNTYYAEKKARELEQLRQEIVELRLRYVHTKSSLMIHSNQTELARHLQSRGIVESTTPPIQLLPEKERPWYVPRFLHKTQGNHHLR